MSASIAAALLLTTASSFAQAQPLQVGAAKVNISPPDELYPIAQGRTYYDPVTMTDVRLPWTGTHDPVFARAVVVDNGASEIAVVMLDLGGVPVPADLTGLISEATGIPGEAIWIAATHNHSMPSVGRAAGSIADQSDDPAQQTMLKTILDGTVEAVVQAQEAKQPAKMGYGSGEADVNVNRDEWIGDRYIIGYNPEGPSEKKVDVLKFESVDTGEPIAFLINYAVHSVVMLTAVTKDGGSEVTSDLAGWTSNLVEDHFGNDAVALWSMGAAGDQNPLFMAMYNQSNLGRINPGTTDLGEGGWALLHAQSARLSEEVIRVAEVTDARNDTITIGAGVSTSICPGGRVVMDPVTAAVSHEAAPDVEVRLQAIRLGDVALAGVNGEVNSTIGQRLKAASPYENTIFITHTFGTVGYIPDDAGYAKATFEATSSRLRPGCAEPFILDGLVQLMNDVSYPASPQ